MRQRSKPAFRNTSHSGWWIYQEVEHWVSKRQKNLSANSRCLVWENTRLIRAKGRWDAYRKAMRLGREEYPVKTNGGEWRFAGISMLLPVFEKIQDGTEILWIDRGLMSIDKIKKLTKTRNQLPVFNDGSMEQQFPGQI